MDEEKKKVQIKQKKEHKKSYYRRNSIYNIYFEHDMGPYFAPATF